MLCNLFCSPTHLYFKRGTNFYLYQEEGKQELAPTSLSLSSTTIVRKERVLRNSHDDSTKIKNAPCQKFLCVSFLLFLFLVDLILKTNLEENYPASCSFNFLLFFLLLILNSFFIYLMLVALMLEIFKYIYPALLLIFLI